MLFDMHQRSVFRIKGSFLILAGTKMISRFVETSTGDALNTFTTTGPARATELVFVETNIAL